MTTEYITKDDLREVIRGEFADTLSDISFRINQAYDLLGRVGSPVDGRHKGSVYAEDMNLDIPIPTGYVTTPNSPVTGSIAWTDLHIVWRGVDYTIANGSTGTANRYATFVKPATYTPGVSADVTLTLSATKPSLTNDDAIVFVNDNGNPRVAIGASLPQVVANNAIDTDAIQANAVNTAQLAANAVTGAVLADGAVTRTGQLGANVVTATAVANGALNRSAQLGLNVVTAAAVADGAVNRTGMLAANVVTAAAVADGAVSRAGVLAANVVGAAAIATGAINRNNQIAANTVTSVQVADGAVVRATQLGTNVVTNTQLAGNAVNEVNVVPGSLSPTRLNTYQHLFY